ncbi:GntR family transcriptional regulator [Paeniroseomonas aquatica]|uniref:GntR family transcriptional regulator n=1 Tax=Paeniroseomonas aquatica TaxID=373043 RepID=UPI003619BE50
MEPEALLVTLDRASPVPVLRQVYLELRRAILAGAIPPGGRLPPTRALAAHLGIARNSVVAAYEQLLAEGFIEGRVGAGSFVSRDMPEPLELPPPPRPRRPPPSRMPGNTAPRPSTPAAARSTTAPCRSGAA